MCRDRALTPHCWQLGQRLLVGHQLQAVAGQDMAAHRRFGVGQPLQGLGRLDARIGQRYAGHQALVRVPVNGLVQRHQQQCAADGGNKAVPIAQDSFVQSADHAGPWAISVPAGQSPPAAAPPQRA